MALKDKIPKGILEAITLYNNSNIFMAEEITLYNNSNIFMAEEIQGTDLFKLCIQNVAKLKTSKLEGWELKESSMDSQGTAIWLFKKVNN